MDASLRRMKDDFERALDKLNDLKDELQEANLISSRVYEIMDKVATEYRYLQNEIETVASAEADLNERNERLDEEVIKLKEQITDYEREIERLNDTLEEVATQVG